MKYPFSKKINQVNFLIWSLVNHSTFQRSRLWKLVVTNRGLR